jgi:hypothetical protein
MLKIIVDLTISRLRDYQKAEDIEVLITLSDASVGARASSRVEHAGLGFDWEQGQFRISPSKPLVTMGNNLSDVRLVGYRIYDGRKYYYCTRCDSRVAKDDKFCRHCGQRLG